MKNFIIKLSEKYVRIKYVLDAFFVSRTHAFLIMNLSFLLGVTEHVFMTGVIGISLIILLGLWVPVNRFVYMRVRSKSTLYSDMMIWVLMASILYELWAFIFVDFSRTLSLYLGLLIMVCFGLQRYLVTEGESLEKVICQNIGFGLKSASFLCVASLIRFIGGYVFGLLSLLCGLFLAASVLTWFESQKDVHNA